MHKKVRGGGGGGGRKRERERGKMENRALFEKLLFLNRNGHQQILLLVMFLWESN